MSRRVVITSVGIFSPLGDTFDKILENFKKKTTCFNRLSLDDSPDSDEDPAICPIENFNIKKIIAGSFKNRRYLNRGAQFCVASAMTAVKNANLNKEMLIKSGVFAGVGPNLDIGGEFPEIVKGEIDRKDLMALWILKFLPNTAASVIAGLAGIHGENLTLSTACAASLQAVGEAYRKIRDGYLDLAFAGGGDSRLSVGGILAYKKAHALFSGTGDPRKASRPFDDNRKGFVPGEGGAFFLLEEMNHAKKRGAAIYGEICGFGSSIDGHNMTAPDPDGKWSEKAVVDALAEAKMAPFDIDVISAHGTSTYLNDAVEAELISRIYGKKTPFVIALKSWMGHLSAACGAAELAVCLACMHGGYIPEIRNLENPCHNDINFVLKGRKILFDNIMVENFGFGGQNSALVVKRKVGV